MLAVAFLSGASALLFETLWFHAGGLAFGNSVWASSLVLASFMAGLALGNGLASRWGARIASPMRAYAILELSIGIGGTALAIGLAPLGELLRPIFTAIGDQPVPLNATRFAFGFVLMTIPATSMGATLPVLLKGLDNNNAPFGRALGRLYAANTVGAVAGSVMGAAVLIGWLGINGTAYVAGALNLLAAALGVVLARREPRPGYTAMPRVTGIPPACRPILVSAFLCGAAFLVLEVLWFRFLSLFIYQTQLAFALMLAVVLTGIAIGGWAAGRVAAVTSHRHRWTAALLLGTGAAALASYRLFAAWSDPSDMYGGATSVLSLSLVLTLPTSCVSGAVFVMLGMAAKSEIAELARAIGLVAFANTTGAALGSLAGGFLVLPWLGIEKGFILVAVLYGIAATSVVMPALTSRRLRDIAPLATGVVAAAVWMLALTFPFGLLVNRFLRYPTMPYAGPNSAITAVREGRINTVTYVTMSRFGRPYRHQLFTDGLSMSGTNIYSQRYMKAFVYLPAALHPALHSALLISFGVGSTAKALTGLSQLEHIDVVDTSSDILEMSARVFAPGESYPLTDPRVRVHVEDGRFFLSTTSQRFDLITGEPPPPKLPGVATLYTREYFDLMRARLNDRGIATYWLPVHNLTESDARAILRAFCDAFDDCSLWTGAGLDWIMMGSRQMVGADQISMRSLWSAPTTARDLARLGFDAPEQLGATFLADAPMLRALTHTTPPVADGYPLRISNARVFPRDAHRMPLYRQLMDGSAARRAFESSEFIARVWPASLRATTLESFRWQPIVNAVTVGDTSGTWPRAGLQELYAVLTHTHMAALPLWLTGSDAVLADIVADLRGPEADSLDALHLRGVTALAAHRYPDATTLFAAAAALARSPRSAEELHLAIFAACMAGDLPRASRLAHDVLRLPPGPGDDVRWTFLKQTFGLSDPRSTEYARHE